MKILSIEEAINDLNYYGGHEWGLNLIENNQDALQMLATSMQSVTEVSGWLTPDKEGPIKAYHVDAARRCIGSLSEILPDSRMISNMFFCFNMINTLLLAIATHLRDQEKGESNNLISKNNEI